MSAAHPPVKDALAPFSGEPDAGSANPASDLILRSSNHVDFHVHKQILAFVSVFFSDMLAFPAGKAPPTEPERDGKPVLLLPESDEVLCRLLRLAYPGRSREQYSITAADLDSVLAVHEAAQKYQFLDAQQLIAEMLLDDALVQCQPHRLFTIGLLRNLPALTQKAALQTLRLPVCPLHLDFPELQLITGANLQRLYAFHRSCGAQASEVLQGVILPQHKMDISRLVDCLTYNEDGDSIPYVRWAIVHALDTVTPATWFCTQIDRLTAKVSAVPVGQTVLDGILALDDDVATMIADCEPCSRRKNDELEDLAEDLARRINTSHKETVKNWVF
ncbi:hypothetical protein FB45DRAFT_1066430 [Roridomyces roridus]|uniref:BTB domain-containing protein n=1 Tax=Roridomyces roridus TaxID=1738132 RepID=A0AAD7FB23_9AGAR|nr:hypothetical protein FB45DRAFT_1066430 [Roridomyces roridus]